MSFSTEDLNENIENFESHFTLISIKNDDIKGTFRKCLLCMYPTIVHNKGFIDEECDGEQVEEDLLGLRQLSAANNATNKDAIS